ncbi:hypothetical protein [Flavobacterium silvaticum]|uniref:Uncharacterized protein n=1 Tax=Flavobacterium silvaticum TaxID=1852020 RepID=A0A972JIW1_9FLAO|nr:hypothetical protein [Flavobacterium silvaticum]NMH27597.1 hypothetical protein [Flavobacterium silvaticum]
MIPNKDYNNDLNNLESDNLSSQEAAGTILPSKSVRAEQDAEAGEDLDYSSPDKYLALEQEGVRFTQESDPMALNPDNMEYRQHGQLSDEWDNNNRNSRNSEAFNQDEYILRDNIDLDEDQSQSISSDEDIDTNTTDEV